MQRVIGDILSKKYWYLKQINKKNNKQVKINIVIEILMGASLVYLNEPNKDIQHEHGKSDKL